MTLRDRLLTKPVAEAMIEAAAEGDEALLDKYLESGELSDDEIRQGLRARTLANE